MVYYRFLPTSQAVDPSVKDAGSIIAAPVVRKGDDVKVRISRRGAPKGGDDEAAL